VHPLLWVLGASVVVWGGLWLYLAGMEGRLRRLEERSVREDDAR